MKRYLKKTKQQQQQQQKIKQKTNKKQTTTTTKKKQEMEKPLAECDTRFLIWTTICVYFYGGITSINV